MRKQGILVTIGSDLVVGIGTVLLANRKPAKYSDKWFKSLSREELDTEREVVQKKWCSAGGDYSLGARLYNLLHLFDDEIRLRDYGDPKAMDYKYPPHREHGWNLYKPD